MLTIKSWLDGQNYISDVTSHSVITFSHVIAFIWLNLNDSYNMSHIYEHFCAWKSFWTDLWPIGAAAWLTLRGPPSTLDTQAIGLAIFSFYLIHFSLRVQFCLVPYFFKSPEFWFLEDWKKIISFFESSLDALDQSDPRKMWRDETDRTTF